MADIIALFGEAEKGRFHTPLIIKSLDQAFYKLGNPPPESLGVFFAIQSLLHDYHILFFRVEEEGFSTNDYVIGLRKLKDKKTKYNLQAISLPGVGSEEIIKEALLVSDLYHCLLMTTEKDLYDYLTSSSF